jgi:hypothetical protein
VNEPETSRVQSLCEWLQIATDKLSTPAKERIRVEIEAHFAESRENHQANGFSEDEARVASLAELGDPYAAGKHFRRRYLTQNEAWRVGEIAKPTSGRVLLIVEAFFYFSVLHDLKRDHASLIFLASAIFVGAVLERSGVFVARRERSKPDIRQLFLIQTLLDGFIMLLFLGLGIWGAWRTAVYFSIWHIIGLVLNLRLWFKLGQIDPIQEAT